MKMRMMVSLLGLAVATLLGCGSGDPSCENEADCQSSTGGADLVDFSCYTAASFSCTKEQIPTVAEASTTQSCKDSGSTPGTACPAAGLIGCCTRGTNETCTYTGGGADPAQLEADCTGSSGTWSTTP